MLAAGTPVLVLVCVVTLRALLALGLATFSAVQHAVHRAFGGPARQGQ
jgi:hypothetical protein